MKVQATDTNRRYVPALGYGLLTALYDPVVAVTTRERSFKSRLVEQADIQEGHDVLDLGCGTATLTVWIKKRIPGANVTGLDGDAAILSRAQHKAKKNGVDIRFDHGLSTELPYAEASFDRVVSSLFFHHLCHDDKVKTIAEVFRVLRPGGQFHVADWGKPQNVLMRVMFSLVRSLDGLANTRDNAEGKLPSLFSNGGFENVRLTAEMATLFGTLAFCAMEKPMCERIGSPVQSPPFPG